MTRRGRKVFVGDKTSMVDAAVESVEEEEEEEGKEPWEYWGSGGRGGDGGDDGGEEVGDGHCWGWGWKVGEEGGSGSHGVMGWMVGLGSVVYVCTVVGGGCDGLFVET